MPLCCRVVHLDLKSSNVLLAADGTAKISDVGLSAQMDHSHISSMPVAGTWAWVAPEVILGGTHHIYKLQKLNIEHGQSHGAHVKQEQ
jgi:serine/threonine protein kinase